MGYFALKCRLDGPYSPSAPMLCDRCQKNEATCFFSFASGSVNITLKDGEKLPESFKRFGRKMNPGEKVPPMDNKPSSMKLCRECARKRDQEMMPGTDQTWAEQWKIQKQEMEKYHQKCREVCQRIGLTIATQKAMLVQLEQESPGLFDLRQQGKFSEEIFHEKYTLRMDKITAAVASKFPAQEFSSAEIRMLTTVLQKLKLNLWLAKKNRAEIADELPELLPEELEELVFLKICLHEAAQTKSERYGDKNAADILAVASGVAKTLYDERAREELRKMGVVSSITLGELVYRYIGKGILRTTAGDSIDDFKVRSALDDFLEGTSS